MGFRRKNKYFQRKTDKYIYFYGFEQLFYF